MGGRAAPLRTLREGLAKLSQTLSTSPQPLSCERSARSCEGSCHAFLPPVPRRWATRRSLANAPRRSCEGSCHAFLPPVPRRWAAEPLPCERSARSCEGSCHAFLPPVPRRWAAEPLPCERCEKALPCLLAARASSMGDTTALLRTLREGLAKVAAMPSCRPCLVDGRRNLLSCEHSEKVLRR